MSKYKYYIFDYHTNRLGCLDLLGNADDSDFIEVLDTSSFRFYFNQKYFDNFDEFLDYLKHLNFKATEAYIEDFRIKPPYEIRQQYYDAAAPCTTLIQAKGRTFCCGPTKVPDGHLRLSAIDDFFKSNKNQKFDIGYIVRMHNSIVNSMIVRPGASGNFRIILPDKKPLNAVVAPTSGEKYCLMTLAGVGNDAIFKSYGIARDLIRRIIEKNGYNWRGQWPETDKETIYEIINFINQEYYALHPAKKDGIVISGLNIQYNGKSFIIKKHKNDKWYIDGDITEIISMFKMSDITELRKFVDKILGKKFRRGLFPECDSKEEIIKLLNEITKCPT